MTMLIHGEIALLKARLIARYRLIAVPGRPEELKQMDLDVTVDGRPHAYYPGRTISLGYGCGAIRVRQHGGERNRDWIGHIDIDPRHGTQRNRDRVFAFLDPFFGHDTVNTAVPLLSHPFPPFTTS